eukprot:1160640-Pelagomonas_calceolata.AAC.7
MSPTFFSGAPGSSSILCRKLSRPFLHTQCPLLLSAQLWPNSRGVCAPDKELVQAMATTVCVLIIAGESAARTVKAGEQGGPGRRINKPQCK